MNRSALAFALLLLLVPVLYATTKSDVVLTGRPHMEFDCPSNVPLHLHVRSGEILIVGTDDQKITVDLAGKNADKIQDVKGRLSFRDNVAVLDLTGGPRSELQIIIHVPKNSDLTARIFAGEVNVQDVTGNKDFELSRTDGARTRHPGDRRARPPIRPRPSWVERVWSRPWRARR